jgi:outer membrane protein assembly factor BamB
MRSLATVVALLTLPLVVGGCSSSTPTQERSECRSRPSTVSSLEAATGRVMWRRTVSPATERPLTVANGNVLVAGPCGAAVLSVASGLVRYDAASAGTAFGVTGDRVFTRDDSGNEGYPVVGTDLTGRGTVDDYGIDDRYYSAAAAVAGDRLLVLDRDGLHAPDRTPSRPSWTVQISGDEIGPVLPGGGAVLVTGADGSTYAVRLADGALLWRSIPPTVAMSYQLRVSVAPGVVLTAATDYHPDSLHLRTVVYATAAATGRRLWNRPALQVMAADRDVTILRVRRAIEAVDTRTGTLRWRRSAPDNGSYRDGPGAALAGGVVVLPAYDETLGLDRAIGRVRWHGPAVSGRLVQVGRVVVASSAVGAGLVAIDARTGATLWTRPDRRHGVEVARAPGRRVVVIDTDLVPHVMAG